MKLIPISFAFFAALSLCAQVTHDFVARDKKGKPVKDLTSADIEVSDNGTKQSLKSLRLIDGVEMTADGKSAPLDELRGLHLVTIVIHLSGNQDVRRNMRLAANEMVKDAGSHLRMSVAVVGSQLLLVQNFTGEKELLRKAIEAATSGQSDLNLTTESTANKDLLKKQAMASGTAGRLAQATVEMFSHDAAIVEGPRATIFSLLSLVRGHFSLPGRKAILYLGEGLYVPTHLDEPFRNLISTANRVNVAFYTVDARGVSTASQNSRSVQEIASSGDPTPVDRGPGGIGPQVNFGGNEQVEAAGRSNAQLTLRQLAESTGGFIVADTNEFSKPMKQLNEEMTTYYEAVYDPAIKDFDGSYRKTSVAPKRADVKVKGREGYFALPGDVRSLGMLPFEIKLIAALDAKPLARDVEFRSTIARFAAAKDKVNGTVIMEVPMSGLQFTQDPEKKLYRARLSMLAQLKNPRGEVVQKFTRDLPLQGAADKAEQVKQGNFIFKEQFTVPPGRYLFESAVIDREAGKIGAKKANFVALGRASGVAISGLTLVRSYQPNVKDLDPTDPFQYQGGRVTPTLNGTIMAVKGAQISVFFVVYVDPAINEKPQVILEYLKDGAVAGRGAVELPAADAQGRIPYVMSSPAASLPPGEYEIHAVVKQGATSAEDRAFVTVQAAP